MPNNVLPNPGLNVKSDVTNSYVAESSSLGSQVIQTHQLPKQPSTVTINYNNFFINMNEHEAASVIANQQDLTQSL